LSKNRPHTTSRIQGNTDVMTKRQQCAYCGRRRSTEEDHVIARQFFPAEQRYRGNLPKVPSCANCNRIKQRAEDGPATFLQFGHDSEGSRLVLEKRIPKTLQKNLRLHRSLRRGLHRVWAKLPDGLIVPMLAIKLSSRELEDAKLLFRMITKGLYHHEFHALLPPNHRIALLKIADDIQFKIIQNLILADKKHQKREVGGGEFKYICALSADKGISAWLFLFKSVTVAAITTSGSCNEQLLKGLKRLEWI